jgi:hypothetical protein
MRISFRLFCAALQRHAFFPIRRCLAHHVTSPKKRITESNNPTSESQLQNPNFIKLQNETCSVFGVFASTGSPLETGAYPGSGGAAERFFWHEDSRFLRALSYGIFTTFQTRFGPGELRRSW